MSRSPRDFRSAEIPLSQLGRTLQAEEEDGSLARELGMRPQRLHQVSNAYLAERAADPRSIFHVWPMSATPRPQAKPAMVMPKPSAHHPLPRRRTA